MEETPDDLAIVTRYFSEFTPAQRTQLAALRPLYEEWNAKINVVSRKDIGSLYEKHVLHSLAIAAVFGFPPGCRILDLGTGGGFPGIPLAIFFPESSFTLADSIGKKIRVVEAVASGLGLKNITPMHTRAETLPKKTFHAVVSRAVAPLGELWSWSKPLLRPMPAGAETDAATGHPVANGLVCLKGGDLAREIAESGARPAIQELHSLFPEPYFSEKFLLYVPLKK